MRQQTLDQDNFIMFDRFDLNLFQWYACWGQVSLDYVSQTSDPQSRFYFNTDFYYEVIDKLDCRMKNQQCTELIDVFAINDFIYPY